jgi:hypothetical protein
VLIAQLPGQTLCSYYAAKPATKNQYFGHGLLSFSVDLPGLPSETDCHYDN